MLHQALVLLTVLGTTLNFLCLLATRLFTRKLMFLGMTWIYSYTSLLAGWWSSEWPRSALSGISIRKWTNRRHRKNCHLFSAPNDPRHDLKLPTLLNICEQMVFSMASNYPMHICFTKLMNLSTTLICPSVTQTAMSVTRTHSTSIRTFILSSSSFLWLQLYPWALQRRELHLCQPTFAFYDKLNVSVPWRPFLPQCQLVWFATKAGHNFFFLISSLCILAPPYSYSGHQPMCTNLMGWARLFFSANSQCLTARLKSSPILCSTVQQYVSTPSRSQILDTFRWSNLSTNVLYHCDSQWRALWKKLVLLRYPPIFWRFLCIKSTLNQILEQS